MAINGCRAMTSGISSLLVSLVTLCFITGCSEKKASESTGKPTNPSDGTTDEGDDDGTTDSGSFDLCEDGLEVVDVSGFSSYVKQLCTDGKLKSLRAESAVYTGGDAKIFKDKVEKGDEETSIRLYTSSLVNAAVEDYWALMQLQLKKPDAYKENFDYDASASLSEVEPSGDTVKYRYAYDSNNGGGVDYDATTKFHVLEEGQAYMSSTTHDKMHETLKSIKALIIINKKSATKTEVFTMSDQTYEHDANQADATEEEAIAKAEEEQARMFKNAKDASQAPDLL